MKKNYVKWLTEGGVTASLYIVLTMISAAFGLSSGLFQIRISEALTILPVFTAASVPGLFIGCILANLLTGAAFWDVIFGAFATLLGALGTRFLRKRRILASLPPVLSNTLILPWILSKVYGLQESLPVLMLLIFAGEFVSCGILGQLFYEIMRKVRIHKTDG